MGGLPLLLALVREDLQLSYSQAGGLASAYLLVYAFMQLPAGYFSDRYSPRKLVSIGTLGLMSLSILLACSQQYWQLLCIQLLLGFFGSLAGVIDASGKSGDESSDLLDGIAHKVISTLRPSCSLPESPF